MKIIQSKKFHIAIAYIFNILSIVLSFALMRDYYDDLQITFLVLGVIYLIFWVICNRKSYMPWSVYIHFCVGVIVQILLNWTGIIPKDGGWFSGLGQYLYVIVLIIHAALIGIANLILFIVDKKKKRGLV